MANTNTYDLKGIREDLVNVIYNVDPHLTPFLSNAPKAKATSTTHEWQTDTYAAAADNKELEGADATFAAAAATVRLSNHTQISELTAAVAKSVEATDRAGRDGEMNYQVLKRGVELKRNMETTLVNTRKSKAVGSNSVARETSSYQALVEKNVSREATATANSTTGGFADGVTAGVDGIARAFTEGLLETVIDSIFTASGEMADTIMVGAFNKRAMNAFTGRATTTDHRAGEMSIVSAADLYKSDYGDLKIMPNAFSSTSDALVYKKDKWAVAFLRNMKTNEIAPTGDAEKRQVIVEFCMEARNEFSSGIVADLTAA